MTKETNEFEQFLDAEKNAPRFSEEVIQSVERKLSKELVRSPRQIMLIYLGLSVFGYFVTLLLCAQNTVGIFGFSHFASEVLHSLPSPYCPLLCGALFTGVPFLVSLAFLNRFQQRFLLFRLWWFLGSIPLVSCFLILILPSLAGASPSAMAVDYNSAVLWTTSAVLTPYLLEALVYLRIRKKVVIPCTNDLSSLVATRVRKT